MTDANPAIARSPFWRRALGPAAVFLACLTALAPTTGDFGLTYDEPAYTFSQHASGQWWELISKARSWGDVERLIEPDALLFYWPYARHGINFHPPLAGQLNLLTHQLFGGFLRDTVARRMASVIEFALTITILFVFLSKRYGYWVGGVAGCSLLLMPRLYGQAHLIDTDIPGLLLWVAAALAFWKGLNEERARGWRVAFGVLVGLGFLEKAATLGVLVPIGIWLAAWGLAWVARRGMSMRWWIDAGLTLGLMALPLCLAYLEITRIAAKLPAPSMTDLFRDRPPSYLPGWILGVPALVWVIRRSIARALPRSLLWGEKRPGLETVAALLAFPPLVSWLGNPVWWQETITRLAHYYAISANRKGALPNIQILYFGQTYEFSAPWHNGWVLIAITVPVGILCAAVIGLVFALTRARRDLLPVYFCVHMMTLPALRMLPTPAHDGVRLFLPTFAFLAGLAGWGAVWLADGLAALFKRHANFFRAVAAAVVLAPAAWSLARIHPYELSYYNAVVGGPRGAWKRGFELSYWYDAFTPKTISALNKRFPNGAYVGFPNLLSAPGTFSELQSLGELRGDLHLDEAGPDYPFMWLLTHDSKAMANTRLLFVLRPWYFEAPPQLDGLRVVTVCSPTAAARAIALQLLVDAGDDSPPDPPAAPQWVRDKAPWLARLWGDGLDRVKKLATNDALFEWARSDPDDLRAGARALVEWARGMDGARLRQIASGVLQWNRARRTEPGAPPPSAIASEPVFAQNPRLLRLYGDFVRFDHEMPFSTDLLKKRPQAFLDAIEILCRRGDAVRSVLKRYSYTDPDSIGGYIDQDLPAE